MSGIRDAEHWTDLSFRIGGFATGNYMTKCLTCGKSFIGDKRALSCLPCAITVVEGAASPRQVVGLTRAALAQLVDDLGRWRTHAEALQRQISETTP